MDPYTYNAVICSVYDGDTIHANIDLGFGIQQGTENSVPGALLRLRGCNARELSEEGGHEAGEHLREILPAGTTVVLRTVKPDKFGGRYDAIVELPAGEDLVTRLISENWVAAWDGVGPRPIPPWPRP
jgi:endonuclease YncB( thermonuclease family)